MNIDDFQKYAHELVDRISSYLREIEYYSVRSQVKPGDVFNALPLSPPEEPDSFHDLLEDFDKIILPGITHWQSPNFFAYFPANSSYPSILGEMLTAALGAQCMVWETSPAAAELEEKVLEWLKQMTGLPSHFHGVIQDTASTATLTAVLTAREKITGWEINKSGFSHNTFRIYCSSEAHSSVDKAVKIAGFGNKNLVKIPVDEYMSLIPEKLEELIVSDIKNNLVPVIVVVTLGTTGTGAIDPVKPVVEICKKYNIWLHIDAAYAGTAFIIPEYRHHFDGIEDADSYVFNPHKWMFTNFDCSAYFVKDSTALIRTFEILPEYLKTRNDSLVNNYRDWGIQLGRRFRALKLWFVIRSFGTSGIKRTIQNHIKWAKWLAEQIEASEDLTLFKPMNFSLVCFYIKTKSLQNLEEQNSVNQKFLNHLNSSGKVYLSHTKVNGIFILRLVIGQTYVHFKHVKNAWKFIRKESILFSGEYI